MGWDPSPYSNPRLLSVTLRVGRCLWASSRRRRGEDQEVLSGSNSHIVPNGGPSGGLVGSGVAVDGSSPGATEVSGPGPSPAAREASGGGNGSSGLRARPPTPPRGPSRARPRRPRQASGALRSASTRMDVPQRPVQEDGGRSPGARLPPRRSPRAHAGPAPPLPRPRRAGRGRAPGEAGRAEGGADRSGGAGARRGRPGSPAARTSALGPPAAGPSPAPAPPCPRVSGGPDAPGRAGGGARGLGPRRGSRGVERRKAQGSAGVRRLPRG